ncbi:MAG: ribosome-binding factor A [Saprospiraceae bacterium]|nr:ribosome-binding factor A [Saprospiraceae bacterium]
MESKRQKQVAELIRRNFSYVMQEEAPNICGYGVMITVAHVRMSPDLNLARIYLSVFGTENKQEPILMLQEELVSLRSKLAQRIKKQVRNIPDVHIYLDDTVDEMYRVDALLKQLEEEGQFGKSESTE